MNIEQLKKAISEAFKKAAEEAAEEAAEKILEECPCKEIKEEPEPWEPKEGDEYYFVGPGANHAPWDNDEFDWGNLAIGNVFRTEEEAEKAVEWLKARKVLFDDAKGFKPNWRNTDEPRYTVGYVYYHFSQSVLEVTGVNIEKDSPGPYFATEEDAKASIKAHEKEWLIYLGVEE